MNSSTIKASTIATISTYRPSLTGENIRTILALCNTRMDTMTPEIMEVIGKLAPFYAKVQNDAIKPAHIALRKETVLESLGISAEDRQASINAINANRNRMNDIVSELSHKQARKQAYDKWLADPASCSVHDMQLVATYRYESGLMNQEEIAIFESGL